MSPSPMPGALLPSPPSLVWVFSCSHTANVMSNSCSITGPSLKEKKKKEKKKSQTPPCLLLEPSRLFSRGCVNPCTMKGNSYVNQTSAQCSPPSPFQLPYIKWLFSSLRNDKWLVALLLAFNIFSLQPRILGLNHVSFCSVLFLFPHIMPCIHVNLFSTNMLRTNQDHSLI